MAEQKFPKEPEQPESSDGRTDHVLIKKARKVYIANDIINTHIYYDSKDGGADFEDLKDLTDCGLGSVSQTHACRWTQISAPSLAKEKHKNIYIPQNFSEVYLRINKEAARILADHDPKKIEGAVLKSLARFEWKGQEIHSGAMTAWKMTMKKGMDQLLEHVLYCVGKDQDKLRLVVEEIFQHSMKLMGLDYGSLVFIFQHMYIGGAERMLSSSENQIVIQEILLRFFPTWVKAEDIQWEVLPCRSEETGCTFSEPVMLSSKLSNSATYGDPRNMEQVIAKILDGYLQSFQRDIIRAQEHSLQQLVTQQTQVLCKTVCNLIPQNLLQVPGDTSSLAEHSSQKTDLDFDSLRKNHSEQSLDTTEIENLKENSMKGIPNTLVDNYDTPKKTKHSESGYETGDPRGVSVPPVQYTIYPVSFEYEMSTGQPGKMTEAAAHEHVLSEKGGTSLQYQSSSKPFHADPKPLAKGITSHRMTTIDAPGSGTGDKTDEESKTDVKTQESSQKSQPSKTDQAEQLLNWVNVKTYTSTSRDPEIQRIMEQVEDALKDEETESPRARAMDTILVLDTSDSVGKNSLDELKAAVHTFIEGIEENVERMNLEENLAVLQVGGRAWVRQHLTNDYTKVRDAVDAMTPESNQMRTGGRTPLYQAFLVCLGAIEGRGGVVNVAGCHRVRPRLIMFTDGRPTDEATEFGPDFQSNLSQVKYALVQLLCEFSSKKHKTTPSPIFWVPVGEYPDRPFMSSLAEVSGGKVVEKEDVLQLCRYYKIQETIGCVFKMVRTHKDMSEMEQQTMAVISALAGHLNEEEKKYILEEVRKKQKDSDNEPENANNFDDVFEDTELVDQGFLLPLGTRVRRGVDWKWNNQDTDSPGTVIQHRKKRDGWLHVMWDNGIHNVYRYGDDGCHDVMKTEIDPRILDRPDAIEIGVQVKRGEDWKSGTVGGDGVGIVVRKRKDLKVKVRWENGHIGKHRFSVEEGKKEIEIFVDTEQLKYSYQAAEHDENEEGAVGYLDPAEGCPKRIWQWWDIVKQEWRMYAAEHQDKLLLAYNQRRDGSCIIRREGKNRRVMFKKNIEKTVGHSGSLLNVQTKVVSELQYIRMLQEEEER